MEFGYYFTDFPYNTKNEGTKYLKCTSFIIKDNEYGPIIFDTGSIYDYNTLLDFLKKQFNLLPNDIRWVFITHIHPDHILGEHNSNTHIEQRVYYDLPYRK